jgi:hypothetical protein
MAVVLLRLFRDLPTALDAGRSTERPVMGGSPASPFGDSTGRLRTSLVEAQSKGTTLGTLGSTLRSCSFPIVSLALSGISESRHNPILCGQFSTEHHMVEVFPPVTADSRHLRAQHGRLTLAAQLVKIFVDGCPTRSSVTLTLTLEAEVIQ